MAQVTKITFSETERDAISQPDFFFIKHAAMQKVMELLSETERALREIVLVHPHLSEHTNIESPKIFRGENYKLLPYMVLDYPRKFTTETVFAFRSMFWWGKEFSFTLHLQGEAWLNYKKVISEKISLLSGKNFYACINASPWQYHFEADNYLLLDDLLNGNKTEELFGKDFIKLSRKIPIAEFENVPSHAADTLELQLQLLL